MLSARKTWDLGHSLSLQELWQEDASLDASAIDFLMSDGEEDTSFLSLQTSAFQRHLATSDLPEPSSQQLLIQALQDKVCEFQARLCSEDTCRRRGGHEPQMREAASVVLSLREATPATQDEAAGVGSTGSPAELRLAGTADSPKQDPGQPQKKEHLRSQESEQQALIGQLRMQVRDLEDKILNQSQEMERLRSELGATDLEKQLKVLVLENERLTQELSGHQHDHLSTDVGTLRSQVALYEEQSHARELRVEELQRRVTEEEARAEQLQKRVEQALQERKEVGQRLTDCQQALSQRATLPPQVKYVTQTVEVESTQSQRSLQEARARNQVLQEQLEVQQELLHELQQQLHESQRASCQLRAQVLAFELEMERCQSQLEAEMQSLEEEKNRVIEEAFIRAESEMKAVHKNLAGVQMNLATLQPALRTLTCDYNCLKRQVQDFPFMLETAIGEAKREICHVIAEVSSANQELLHKYKREMNLRKKCHDELVRLKGNIRVFCRVRPVSQQEFDSSESRNIVTFDPDDDAVVYLANKGKLTFELDKVFPPQATQEEVFKEVQSLITSCIDGYNVCIFAYGQTGSGKTYTMEGTQGNPGINQRALQLLFTEVSEKAPDWEFRITVSMVEIYNETLRNLLGENPNEKLEVKMCPDGRGQLYVPGLTEVRVQSVEDINKVFNLGYLSRATACTNLNEHSSRSHALLIVTVTGVNSTTGHRTSGKLNLVDLAGSERISRSGAEGSRLREAQCINRSLSALGDVIHALRTRQSHVPFRNSRLTYLLQDSLSGDSKTLMMVQVSPLDGNLSESVCSLKFAQRVRSVELGPAGTRKPTDSPPTSASPVHDGAELDSPPLTPVSIPIARVGSTGSLVPSSIRRKSHSHLSSGRPGRMKIPA